eukprot:g8797.t1
MDTRQIRRVLRACYGYAPNSTCFAGMQWLCAKFDVFCGHAMATRQIRRGVFAGTFRSAIAPLTFAALANGFLQVPDSVRARLDKLERVELCVFLAAELEAFQKAHHDILASQPDSSL